MSGIFDNFFSEEARAKRNPTREETHYNAEHAREVRSRTDFSSIWPNVSIERGGVDGDIPIADWWHQEYLKLQERKESITVGDVVFTVYENGNVRIQQGPNVLQVRAEDRMAFQGALFALPSTGSRPGGPAGQGAMGTGQSSSNSVPQVKSDNPIIAERQRQNEERMAFAYANQARYQDDLGRKQQEERRRRLREELG